MEQTYLCYSIFYLWFLVNMWCSSLIAWRWWRSESEPCAPCRTVVIFNKHMWKDTPQLHDLLLLSSYFIVSFKLNHVVLLSLSSFYVTSLKTRHVVYCYYLHFMLLVWKTWHVVLLLLSSFYISVLKLCTLVACFKFLFLSL